MLKIFFKVKMSQKCHICAKFTIVINLSFLQVKKINKKCCLPEIYQIWKQRIYAIHFSAEEIYRIIVSFTKRRNFYYTNYLRKIKIYHFCERFTTNETFNK